MLIRLNCIYVFCAMIAIVVASDSGINAIIAQPTDLSQASIAVKLSNLATEVHASEPLSTTATSSLITYFQKDELGTSLRNNGASTNSVKVSQPFKNRCYEMN
jgi:hypothetical protein